MANEAIRPEITNSELPLLIWETDDQMAQAKASHEEAAASLSRRGFLIGGGLALAAAAGGLGKYEYQTHHAVANHVTEAKATNILSSTPNAPSTSIAPESPSSTKPSLSPSKTPEKPKIPELAPTPPTRLIIPKLGIDTDVLPVSATPTGRKNPWGGIEYNEVEFPVDSGKQKARYWVQQGEPNTLKNVTYQSNPKAAMRTIIYGHASDIGHNLLFQHLENLKNGQDFTLFAGVNAFTYKVYYEANPAKSGLADDSQVYNLPPGGRKEAALIACLPNSASHSVRIGYLLAVTPAAQFKIK